MMEIKSTRLGIRQQEGPGAGGDNIHIERARKSLGDKVELKVPSE